MAFDITSVLQSVSGPDTGKEQIEYIALDKLDPDENNFYSLNGLGELAENIELIGLQQPLRVRPGSEPGRFTIVSGHRRRAAILMIADGGSDQFKDGVPCIVDRGEASAALRELRLIYANAATRVMTSAEQSKQAERVEMLLYELKEEGMEFPGRMRDHVAEACKLSKTKLARLHAIRKNLVPRMLDYFDKGELNETAAYELQKLPEKAQELIADYCEKRKSCNWFYSWQLEKAAERTEIYLNPKTGRICGGNCTHKEARFLQALRSTYIPCEGGCCLNCGQSDYCEVPCQRALETRKQKAKDQKAEQAERDKERLAAQEKEQQMLKDERRRAAMRLLPLIEEAGLSDDYAMPATHPWNTGTKVSYIRKMAMGEFGDEHYYSGNGLLPENVSTLGKWADVLRCSVDYLAGRTEDPDPEEPEEDDGAADGPQWKEGEPKENGRYLCMVDMQTVRLHEQRCEWKDGCWYAYGNPMHDLFKVIYWFRLPTRTEFYLDTGEEAEES